MKAFILLSLLVISQSRSASKPKKGQSGTGSASSVSSLDPFCNATGLDCCVDEDCERVCYKDGDADEYQECMNQVAQYDRFFKKCVTHTIKRMSTMAN